MTISRLAALTLAAAVAFAPLTATARTESAELTLQQPAAQNEFIIDGARWNCDGATCRSGFVDDMPALRSCKRVVAVTGAVTAFSWRGRALNEAEIAVCNTKAKA